MPETLHVGPRRIDRYTQVGELGESVRHILDRGIYIIGAIVTILAVAMFLQGVPGWLGLVGIGIGTCFALAVWKSAGIGLPLIPMIALQHLVAYGIPIFNHDEITAAYAEAYINQCGIEILVFLVATTATWRIGMEIFTPSKPEAYALKIFRMDDESSLRKVAFGLVGVATAYNVLETLRLTDIAYSLLPNGTYSISVAIINAAAMAGYFLLSMWIGNGHARGSAQLFLWLTLALNGLLMTSGFLLSATTNLMAAVVLGSFWGSGRLPWRFLLIVISILSFLHVGKFEMRERYWDANGTNQTSLANLPDHYLEWFDASYATLTFSGSDDSGFRNVGSGKKKATQSMLGRVNNLQNLLYAITAIESEQTPTLNGATYSLIPPLLIPRILWPEKPRAHEGQVMLNVHFGRQSLQDTLRTYVAWGLVPEAYGNFGSIWGAIILGGSLGLFFAWMENATARKPLLSLEGLVSFALLIGLAVSFEMVASVLVTSLFQNIITITMACAPFVHRTLIVRPKAEELET